MPMRSYPILAALVVLVLAVTSPGGAALAPAAPASSHSTQLVSFHFGGRRSFGGGGFLGRGRGSSHHFLRHVGRTLALAYVLHLLFSHGGSSILIWLIVIAVVVHLLRRRRRRRSSY